MNPGKNLTDRNQRVIEGGKEDLSRHNKDILSIKKRLPLFPSLWMPVNFRTHPFDTGSGIRLDHVALLKDQMDQWHYENTYLLLSVNHIFKWLHLRPSCPIHSLLDQNILNQ